MDEYVLQNPLATCNEGFAQFESYINHALD